MKQSESCSSFVSLLSRTKIGSWHYESMALSLHIGIIALCQSSSSRYSFPRSLITGLCIIQRICPLALNCCKVLLRIPEAYVCIQEDQRELACIIRVCGRILLSTVSNFLDYFKIEAGGILDLVETEIDLPKLMDEIQGVIQAMVGVENQEIEIKDPVLHSVPPVCIV